MKIAQNIFPASIVFPYWLCSVLLAYGLGRIYGMKASLEEERALHE